MNLGNLTQEIRDRELTILAEVLDDTANTFRATDLVEHDFDSGVLADVYRWVLARVEQDRFHGLETAEVDLALPKKIVQAIRDHWGTPATIQSTLDDLRRKRRVRDWSIFLHRCAQDVIETRDVETVLAKIHTLSAGDTIRDDLRTTRQVMIEAFDELVEVQEGKRVSYYPTGNKLLDDYAPEPGETTIIGARSSIGKSIFAATIATHMAGAEKIPVLFVSLEMSDTSIMKRNLAKAAGVHTGTFRAAGSLTMGQFDKIGKYVSLHRDMPLYWQRIDTTERLVASVVRYKHQYGIKVVFLDYLQNVHFGAGERQDLLEADAIRRLDACGKSNRICFMIASQVRKPPPGTKEGRPKMSDLSGSGAIRNTADHIWLLHRPGYYTSDPDVTLSLKIAKYRNGPTGAELEFEFDRGVLPQWKI